MSIKRNITCLCNSVRANYKHEASQVGDRPSVYRVSASLTPTKWQDVYQQFGKMTLSFCL